ncbi:MAG: RHS repeat-associated core domain-containing protein [Comamonas sp.]
MNQPRRHIQALLLAASLTSAVSAWADTQTRTSSFEYDASGLLVKEVVNPDNPNACLQTSYVYDARGNITQRSSAACANASGTALASASAARTSKTSYTADGRFAASATNALGQSETRQYHPVFGSPTQLTGPNGLVTTWQYDGFGRKIRETRADGTYTSWDYLLCSQSGANCPGAIGGNASKWVLVEKHWTAASVVNGPTRRTYHDALGRVTRTQTEGFANNGGGVPWLAQDTEYDSLGRIARQSNTYTLTVSPETPQWTSYAYDALGRITQQREPNSDASGGLATTSYAYNGLVTTVTNPKGQKQTTQKDARGNVVKVTDHAGQTIVYSYDARGNLIQTNAAGAITTLAYDHRGNKIAMNDPAMGAWTYAYNIFGELVQQRDSLNQTSTLEYDKLGRLLKRTEADLVSQWSHDKKFDGSACGAGIGKLCEAKADNGYQRTHTYDSLGRPATTATTLDSATSAQSFNWAYNAATGKLIRQQFPTGYELRFAYNNRGYLTRAASGTTGNANGSEIDILARNARGQVTQYRQGGVITTVNTFDIATGLLKAIEATTAGQTAGNLLKHSYGHDSLGNLASRIDSATGTQESFVYDTLNRLTQYTLLGGAISPPKIIETRYDTRGNLTYKSDVGTYSYDSARKDRLKAIATTTASGAQIAVSGTRAISYTWDDALAGAQTIGTTKVGNGNLQLMVSLDAANNRNLYTKQTYTSYNMPSQIARGAMNGTAQGPATHTLAFVYGSEHQRVKQTVTGGEQAGTTWYLNGEDSLNLGYEKTVLASGLTEHKHYLVAAGITYATYTSRSGTLGGKAAQEVNYLHGDHLGSVAAVSSKAGALLERLAYDPWGKRRKTDGTADPTDAIQASTGNRGYTLHEHLEEVALTHMNGRIYDPYIGRFLSADPYIQSPANLQSYNRYAYVLNNPLTLTDPTGYWSFKKFFKKVIRPVVAIAVAYYTAGFVNPYMILNGYGLVAANAAAGAAGGFAGGLVGSGGHLKAAVHGGISGGVFGAIGGFGKEAGWNSGSLASHTKFAAAHAAGGCVTSVAQGGKCGSGAMAAGFAKFATQAYSFGNGVADGIKAAVVGGTASVIGGGKFENGAVTAAYGYLFNYCMSNGKCFTTDSERSLLSNGNYAGYYKLACEGGDAYACQAGEIAAGKSLPAIVTTVRLIDYASDNGVLLSQDGLDDIRLKLAVGYANYLGDSLGNSKNPSEMSIAKIHWNVFGEYGIPPRAFGGTPLGTWTPGGTWYGKSYPIFIGGGVGWCPKCVP